MIFVSTAPSGGYTGMIPVNVGLACHWLVNYVELLKIRKQGEEVN